MAPSPSRDSGWQAAAPDTLWQDQGSPLAVSGSMLCLERDFQAFPTREEDGSPRVVDQTAAPALALDLLVGAAFWFPRSLLVCVLGPLPMRLWQPSLFPIMVSHGCAPLAGGTATALPAQLHPPLAGAGGGQERPSAHAMRNEKAQTPHLIHIGTPLRPVTPLCHARSVGTPVPDGVGTNLPEIFGTPVPSQRDSSSAMLEANSDHGKQNTIPQSQ
jgi:hypothetical protein